MVSAFPPETLAADCILATRAGAAVTWLLTFHFHPF